MNSKPLKMLSFGAIVGAFALANVTLGASAATVADVTATAQGDIVQTASDVVAAKHRGWRNGYRGGNRYYGRRHGGWRYGYRSGNRYYGRRHGYRGWGYVAPYWGYPGSYYGPSVYVGPYYDEAEPRYYDGAPPSGDRCAYWHRQCVKNWGANNPDYYGCMRYEKCGR